MKKFTSALLLSIMTLSSIFPASVTNAQKSQDVDAQIVNLSHYEISKEAGHRKNFTAVITHSETENLNGRSNILILDKGKKFNSAKLQKYDLVVGLEEVNSNDTDLILSWTGLNKNGVPVSGEVEIGVDYSNFSENQKKEYTEDLAEETQIVEAIKDALEVVNSDTTETSMTILTTGNYDWTSVSYSQVSGFYAPYGKIRMNYNVKKAHYNNGTQDHFFSSHLNTQINPGAQLCGTDSTYECKYITESANLRIEPKNPANTPFVMLEHQPVNDGNSGSQGYSIGGGYSGGTWSGSAAYNWSQNWSDLDLMDNSDSWGNWDYSFGGSLQSQVQTVTAGSVFATNDQYTSHYVNNYSYVIFDSWNTLPVQRVVSKGITVTW